MTSLNQPIRPDEAYVYCECGTAVTMTQGKTFELGGGGPHTCITDEELDEYAAGKHGAGFRNCASSLRLLSPSQRALAVREGRTRLNLSPGWNFSGAVSQAVQDVLAGRTPCLDRNRELMEWDPTGEKAAALARQGKELPGGW